jgi:3-deoxy-D-arabino-heptulosonate 7-phosphate (DAHP) synthase class II
MVLLNEPNGTLGKIIKRADLDEDIQRLISQVYGVTSNKAFVRHGGVAASSLSKYEAEFFLEFAAAAIVYISAKLKYGGDDA